MAVTPILETDTMNQGRIKINQILEQSNSSIQTVEGYNQVLQQGIAEAKQIATDIGEEAKEIATEAIELNTAMNEETRAIANNANGKANNVQDQLNNLVLESGNSDAEVVQARENYATLRERLVNDFTTLLDFLDGKDVDVNYGDYTGTLNRLEFLGQPDAHENDSSSLNYIKNRELNVLTAGLAKPISGAEKEYLIDTVALEIYNYENPGITFYFPEGLYHQEAQVYFQKRAGLKLSENATIQANTTMNYMYYFDNIEYVNGDIVSMYSCNGVSGGTFDANNLAKEVFIIRKSIDFHVSGLTIKNFLTGGVRTMLPMNELKMDSVLMINETYMPNDVDNYTNCIGIDIPTYDNYFHNVTVVNCKVGIRVGGASNYFDKIHVWYANEFAKESIAFWVTELAWAFFEYCYPDTAETAFKIEKTAFVSNCRIFSSDQHSQHFTSDPVAFSLGLSYYDCSIRDVLVDASKVKTVVSDMDFSDESNYDFKKLKIYQMTYWGETENKFPEADQNVYFEFVPDVYGDTTKGTFNAVSRRGFYQRSGKRIDLNIVLKGTFGNDISGDIIIGGLPKKSIMEENALGLNYISNALATFPHLMCKIIPGTQTIKFWYSTGSTFLNLTGENLRGKYVEIYINGSYFIPQSPVNPN